MVFELLDDRVQKVLLDRDIHEPTGPQREAIPIILRGEHLLLVAHTGIGKTEAAMLIFHSFLTSREGHKVHLSPAGANRDMPEAGVRKRWKPASRCGRGPSQARGKPDPNPRTLYPTPGQCGMFPGRAAGAPVALVGWCGRDRELAGNGGVPSNHRWSAWRDRRDFQRMACRRRWAGGEVARYLGGGREVRTVRAQVSKDIDVTVQSPPVTEEDRDLAGRLQSDPHLVAGMRRCKRLIEEHRSTLLFVNTRDTAEALAARYRIWDEDLKIGVHHGSLSKDIRVETEEDFKQERLKGLICTSSLELGIDIGSVDFAIQYNSPRQVARLIQRMGRAGHAVGERTEGAIVASNPDEIAESMVIARKAGAGELEDLRVRERPMAVLANQLVAMAMVGQVEKELAYQVVRRAYPFRNLSREEFRGVLDQLVRIGLLFDNGSHYRRTSRGMRCFYDNLDDTGRTRSSSGT